MLAWLPDSLKLSVAAIGGAVVAGAMVIIINSVWWLPAAKEEGKAAERSAALQRSMDLIKARGVTNDAVGRLSDSDLCRRLGGRWVRNAGTCE